MSVGALKFGSFVLKSGRFVYLSLLRYVQHSLSHYLTPLRYETTVILRSANLHTSSTPGLFALVRSSLLSRRVMQLSLLKKRPLPDLRSMCSSDPRIRESRSQLQRR